MNVDASIKADTAYYYDKQKLWKLIGHVDIKNRKGERFNTELSVLESGHRKGVFRSIYTYRTTDRIITGHGFDSNQQMTIYEIKNMEGFFMWMKMNKKHRRIL